jgi:hypothetical protein
MSIDWSTDDTWKRIYEPKTSVSGTAATICEAVDDEEDEDDGPAVVRKCLINLELC